MIHLSYLSSSSSYDVFVILDVLQACAAIICFLACLSLPRRPVVEEGGMSVDGQYTVSALGRYTFIWAGVTLVLAREKKTLGLDDLPKLHMEGRSAYRQRYLSTLKPRDQLWKTLVSAHLLELLFQTILTSLMSAAQFIPQLVMYQLLKRLESRAKGAPADRAIWGLVIALGLAIILPAWTQAWLHCTYFSEPLSTFPKLESRDNLREQTPSSYSSSSRTTLTIQVSYFEETMLTPKSA